MIAGQGLHGGAPARVSFARCEGDSVLCVDGRVARFEDLEVTAAVRSTTVKSAVFTVATVEHLFAAAAACGAYRGLAVTVDGPEIPLADGAAAAFVAEITALAIPRSSPRSVIVKDGTVVVGDSVYGFSRGDTVEVTAEIDFGDARLAPRASWDGTLEGFERISHARTFGFAHEVGDLLARGLASHVLPESVVVIGDEILSAGRPFEADEPARHKLLDLIGDLFVHGGPPIGRLTASKPGHASTHAAMLQARALGYVAACR